jgi:hypothetical protein
MRLKAVEMTAIGGEFLRRVRKSAIVFGLVLAVPLATSFGLGAAGGWIAGGVWSLFNLVAIAALIRRVLTLEPRDRREIAILLLVKFPLLYAIGFGILASGLPAIWVLAGFTWPLLVAVLKAAGRSYLGLDTSAS